MKIPNFANSQFVNKDGYLTNTWQQIFSELFNELQKNVSNEGLIAPSQPTTNLPLLGGSGKNGSILYNSDIHEGVICRDGDYKKIVTEPLSAWIDSDDFQIFPQPDGGIQIELPDGDAANQLLGMDNAGTDQEYKDITGTTDQVTITNTPGEMNFSTPETYKRLCYLEASGLIKDFNFTWTTTTFSVAANIIQCIDNSTDVDNPVRYVRTTPALTNITPIGIGAGVRTYLYWDITTTTPTLYQSLVRLNRTDSRTKISFGQVVHSTVVAIDYVATSGFFVSQQGFATEDFVALFYNNNLREITPGRFYSYGANLLAKFSNSSSSLVNAEVISITAGTGNTKNIQSVTAVSPIPYFLRFYFDIYGYPHYTISPYIDPSQYRTSAGTLAAVPTGYWTVQRFFYFSTGEKIVAYGLNYYESDRLAIQSYLNEDWSQYLTNPISAPAIFAGYLIVKQGATNLQDTTQAIWSYKDNPIRITPIDTVNRGIVSHFTIANPSALNITWAIGTIYDIVTKTSIDVSAGSATLTNNSVNYLYWNTGTTLSYGTTKPSGNQINIATFYCQDNIIYAIIVRDELTDREANLLRGIDGVFPTRISYGLSVKEDTDATYAFDVVNDPGVFYFSLTQEIIVPAIYSRTTNLIRHYHSGGAWTYDTNAQIDIDYYDNGTNLVLMNNNYYSKSAFLIDGNYIHWIYPRSQNVNIANALASSLPETPPGLIGLPLVTAYVHKRGDTAFAAPDSGRWIDLRGITG